MTPWSLSSIVNAPSNPTGSPTFLYSLTDPRYVPIDSQLSDSEETTDAGTIDPPGWATYRRALRRAGRRNLPVALLLVPVVAWSVSVGGLGFGVLGGIAALGWLLAYVGGVAIGVGDWRTTIGTVATGGAAVLLAARYASVADGTGGIAGFFLVLFGAIALVLVRFGVGAVASD
jgi:hypothetical protein